MQFVQNEQFHLNCQMLTTHLLTVLKYANGNLTAQLYRIHTTYQFIADLNDSLYGKSDISIQHAYHQRQ